MNKKSKLSPAVKWLFGIFILIGMILSVVFGSIFFLTPKLKATNPVVNNNIHSNIQLRIKEDNFQTSSKRDLAPNKVAEIIKNYLQVKEDQLTSNFDVNLLSADKIQVKSLLATTDDKRDELINLLTNKPYLTVTDHTGKPLFYKGRFQDNFENFHGLDELIKEGSRDFNMDLDANPASDKIDEGYSDRIKIKLNDYAWDQFTRLAFFYFLRSNQTQNLNFDDPENKVYFWLNLDEFIKNSMKNDKKGWEAANGNPVNYAYVGNDPRGNEKRDENGRIIKKGSPFLKNSINAQKYLISAVSPISLISTKKRDSIFYLINNSPNGYSNRQLASLINFSYTPFLLEKVDISTKTENDSLFVNKVNKPTYQYDSYILVIVIIFALMSIFLGIKYRLLGAISVVVMAFLLFVLLSIIVAFGVVINSLIAITIISMLFVVFILVTKKLQIFEKEIFDGSSTSKAMNKANKKSVLSSLDLLATLGISSIIAFYLNVNHSSTIGAIIGIASLLILAIITGLYTLVIRSLIQSDIFEKKKKLLLHKAKIKTNLSSKIDIFLKAKFFIVPIILIFVTAFVVFTSFAIKDKSLFAGFNTKEFFGKNIMFSFRDTNIGYMIGWTTLLIVLINVVAMLYITFRYSVQDGFIYLIKNLISSLLVISFLVIIRSKIDNFIYDGLILVTFINVCDGVINSSRINSEIKKDINTKNYIYTRDQIKDIFSIWITDIFLVQNVNLLLGIAILITAPFLLVNISFSVIFSLGFSIVIMWYLNLFIIPRIWEALLIKKYSNKQIRIQKEFWKTQKIEEQTFIGINDFSM
ncbi:protein translocase subunit SecDF [Metamycoplasma auris]|uniref:SecD/SecF fusion protein n=1 Tax=Metamycoplasma auris TaxID=51363 RepID=A0A2W7GUJ5_9BACT|nr:peptide transporter [Metamycoplasma auris]PZW01413.1 SecD/SecF fusion protein [Metamycoplasma auris]